MEEQCDQHRKHYFFFSESFICFKTNTNTFSCMSLSAFWKIFLLQSRARKVETAVQSSWGCLLNRNQHHIMLSSKKNVLPDWNSSPTIISQNTIIHPGIRSVELVKKEKKKKKLKLFLLIFCFSVSLNKKLFQNLFKLKCTRLNIRHWERPLLMKTASFCPPPLI